MGTLEENKAVFRRLVEEGPNKASVDAIDDAWAEDGVLYAAGVPEPVRGRDAIKEHMRANLAVWSDIRMEIDEIVAEGDRVVALTTFIMTNTPTRKRVRFQGAHFLRFSDGRIVENRQIADNLAIMTQLGLVPTPESE